ncbi:hypothetical protein ACN26Z_20265 [Verrucosispora sp. WMMD703]|uniref:Uncharacterized protein n=1 Tax=Micromonospora sediminimaris TaxID=547162 RepID=A0A9W5XN30_9ACTN|nr:MULTISPECIES: acetyl xylan esterase [Micromonospora]WFE47860.1 hypothetical protein O7624_27735 [Verrucosispora sp. WMMD1129]GIJ35913.1 hypothetical protein Vse01_50610 [Micromonospora sediminimaris]SFD42572.1 hypothetical protein SAMN05216284_116167 [Micromonospora sediminimaris]
MDEIREWIRSRNPSLTGDIGEDDDLIEARLIDSLDFLDFVYLLEEVSGSPIDLQQLSVDDFRTLGRIRKRFLPAE